MIDLLTFLWAHPKESVATALIAAFLIGGLFEYAILAIKAWRKDAR